MIGDRISPQNMIIQDKTIIVNYVDREIDEEMSAQPSIGVSRYFILKGDELTETWPLLGEQANFLDDDLSRIGEVK